MTVDAWLALAVIGLAFSLLVTTRFAADLILAGALTVLIITQVITPAQALSGLANPGLATVAVLFVVAAGLADTGAIHTFGARLLGRPKTIVSAQLRLMLPTMAMSGFLNNTPVVAMLVPVVEDWCKRCRISASKLMIPLSYAAIFGGTCTLIGTSTNIIVNGLAMERPELGSMGFFAIGAIGLPSAIVGVLFVLGTSRWLLRERKPLLQEPSDVREYTIEMLVEETSPMIGKSVEEAGLRNLPGAFLAEIDRSEGVVPAVAPTERLRAGDRLLFVGMVDSVVDLVRQRGLVPAPDQLFKLTDARPERVLVEVVVSDSCPVVGRTIRDGRFRSRYNAVVIAVARNGQRLRGKVGDIEVRTGDTLLLESGPIFLTQHARSRDFLLVSTVQGATLPRHEKAGLAAAILLGMVAVAASGLLSMFEAALLAAAMMIITRCTTASSARASIDWSVLIVIAAALGIGQSLQATGAAGSIMTWWIELAGPSPWLALAAVYAATSVLTELITNNAAAVLIFPIAEAVAQSLGVSFWPFIAVIMMAASASFATPIGYQTNLMVYGPGGYRFSDYILIGLPLNVLLGVIAVLLAPTIWPF